MGIFSILSALATVNLLKPQTQASIDSTVEVLIADIKQQQLKAMVGDSEGQASTEPQGIYFETEKYTFFRGHTFNLSDPNNFTVNLETSANISNIAFPSSQVVFLKRSGEVSGYIDGSNTLSIVNTQNGQQKTITINRYGSLTIN